MGDEFQVVYLRYFLSLLPAAPSTDAAAGTFF